MYIYMESAATATTRRDPRPGGLVVINELSGDDHHQDELMDLPPGFRFHPTDEEIITHYLTPKVVDNSFCARAIGQVDLNKCEPWDLPKKAKMGEKEWFFFCQRDRKYPTGMRTNRATESGYWKATGKDKEIYNKAAASNFTTGGCVTKAAAAAVKQQLVGMKKTLVFYRGRAPKGEKTNWVMHEFRLEGNFSYYYNFPKPASKDEWVVCRVFHKNSTGGLIKRSPNTADDDGHMKMSSFVDDLLDFGPSSYLLPPLTEHPNNEGPSTSSFTTPHSNIGRRDDEAEGGEEDFQTRGVGPNELSVGNYLSSYFSMNNHQEQQDQKSFLDSIIIDHHQYPITNNYTSFNPNPFGTSQMPNSLLDSQLSIPNINTTTAGTSNYFPLKRSSSVCLHHDMMMPNLRGGYSDNNIAIKGNHMNEQASLRALVAAQNNRQIGVQCKTEVSLSQDTGLSNDMTTTEISSSKQEMARSSCNTTTTSRSDYDDDDGDYAPNISSSAGPLSDLDLMWN